MRCFSVKIIPLFIRFHLPYNLLPKTYNLQPNHMSSWSQRRKASYSLGIIIFLFIVLVLPAYLLLYKKPTCFDNKKNGGEKGVDCGGPCANLCRSQYLEPNVRWAQSIQVKPGLYNALAYIENPNIDAGVDSVEYIFKIKDKDGVLIYERKGKTFIPPNRSFAVFEGGILTGEKIPTKVTFEFTSYSVWKKLENKEAGLSIMNEKISNEDESPRLDATLENNTIQPILNIEVVVIAYDESGNALGFSRTFIDKINKGESQNITFTWPNPFGSSVAKIEIIPRVMNSSQK